VRNVRLWIVLLALLSFLAGAGTGHILTERAVGAEDRGPMSDYEALLVRRFDLGAERRRALRVVLQSYQQEIDEIETRYLVSYRSAIEPELRRVGAEYDRYVRDRVLPPSERVAFDSPPPPWPR